LPPAVLAGGNTLMNRFDYLMHACPTLHPQSRGTVLEQAFIPKAFLNNGSY